MRVSEGQRLGSTLLLIVSLVIYGSFFFMHQRPVAQLHLPWGEQSAGTVAVEIATGGKGDGIYFSPATEGLLPILYKTGLPEKISASDLFQKPFPGGFALSIESDRGMVKCVDMAAVKRLALGLPIDLNSASVVELSMVPGIGASMAARIVELRQSKGKFQTLSDLKKITGIKDHRLKRLGQYLQISTSR
jgi:competence ComEA-like helix-hairpin-helix protein